MINIDFKDETSKIIKKLNHIERSIVPAATIAALNKTGAKLKSATATNISRSTGIPKKIINGTSAKAKVKIRGRLKLYKANRASPSMKLWMGVYNISAASLGNIKRTRKGVVKVGRIVFPDAFLITMKNGRTDYYQRKGQKIKKAAIDIKKQSRRWMLHARHRLAPSEFKKQLIVALKWKLGKYAKS